MLVEIAVMKTWLLLIAAINSQNRCRILGKFVRHYEERSAIEMPGFDQTGPVGNGPMTGRGRGRCFSIPSADAQQTQPAYGLGRGGSAYGCGMGRGAGMRNSARMGLGRRNFSSGNPVDTQDLEEELARARERIETLEARLKELKPNTSE